MCYISGWILIDRCGKHFGLILNFLRDGLVPLPDNCKEMAELLAEAKYYCISELAGACEQALLKKEREAEPICRVPLITSQKEEQLLINSTTKVIKFFTYLFLSLWFTMKQMSYLLILILVIRHKFIIIIIIV